MEDLLLLKGRLDGEEEGVGELPVVGEDASSRVGVAEYFLYRLGDGDNLRLAAAAMPEV